MYYMDKPTTLRLPKDLLRQIKEISGKEYLDSSTVIRKLLVKAIAEWKKENALEELRKGIISVGKAAEKAEIAIWDMVELAKEEKIDWTQYSEEELERDIKIIGG